MKKIFIKLLGKTLEVNTSIIKVIVEDPICFREISCNLMDNIIYSENDIVLDLDKMLIIIYNPYQIDVNDSKLLKHLYKKIEKNILEEFPKELIELENSLFDLLDKLMIKNNYSIDYQSNIDIPKLLASLNVTYEELPLEKYVDRLIQYIEVNKEINKKLDLIVSFGLLNLMSQEETSNLEEYFFDNGISLIDISFNQKNTKISLIVDGDWCII